MSVKRAGVVFQRSSGSGRLQKSEFRKILVHKTPINVAALGRETFRKSQEPDPDVTGFWADEGRYMYEKSRKETLRTIRIRSRRNVRAEIFDDFDARSTHTRFARLAPVAPVHRCTAEYESLHTYSRLLAVG